MGLVTIRHLLGYQMDVGDQPLCPADHDYFLARGFHGRHGRRETVAPLRIALGSGRHKQSVAPLFPPRVRTLWLVSPMAHRPPFSPRRAPSFSDFSCARHSLAGAQPARLRQARFFTDELRRRTAHGERSLRRRYLAVLSSSRARRGGVSPIRANGGTSLCPGAERRSGSVDQGESGTLRRCEFPEIYLLLVWRAARPATRVA